jgi:hypothetical protein
VQCWWVLCTLTLAALPLMIWDFRRKGYNIKLQGWFIGGVFVIMSIPISVYEVRHATLSRACYKHRAPNVWCGSQSLAPY